MFGPKLIKSTPFFDERGFFLETWNKSNLNREIGSEINFVQDNLSFSKYGVLRGLHYQKNPKPQGKLIRCIEGEIFDVVVDLRQNSNTYSKWKGYYLKENEFYQLWIPEGFAHGFLTLSIKAKISYKTTDYWSPECERTLIWNDSIVNITWPKILVDGKISDPILSDKDKKGSELKSIKKEDLFI